MKKAAAMVVLLLVALVLAWPALSVLATARGGDTAESASPVVLTDEQDGYPLGLHLEILKDPDGQLTIEQVASPEYDERFVPNHEKTPNLGYTDSAYWVRFRARNETAETHDWRHWLLNQVASRLRPTRNTAGAPNCGGDTRLSRGLGSITVRLRRNA
jgi:hypothetical protein